MLKEGVLLLSLLSSFALAIVVPISPFKMGDNAPDGNYEYPGVSVNSKIYIFGGVHYVKTQPYVVDPEAYYETIHIPRQDNTTDLSFVYDIFSDKWEFETKTPIPWERAGRVTVGTSIYFYDIQKRGGKSARSRMYEYNTLTKEWSRKSDIPFLWHSDLISCYNNVHGRIYFTNRATYQPEGRTMIHSYDVNRDQWDEETILTREILAIRQLMCAPNSFKVVAEQHERSSITGEVVFERYSFNTPPERHDLFTISIDGNAVVAHNVSAFRSNKNRFHIDVTQMSVFNEYFYQYKFNKDGKASLSRFNTITLENDIMEAELPYNFSSPLVLPINQDELFLFGGYDDRRHFLTPSERRNNVAKSKVTTWNHKIVKY